MQEERGAVSWMGFLVKLVTFLGAIFLILVVLSWLRCSGRSSGGEHSVLKTVFHPSGLTGFPHIR